MQVILEAITFNHNSNSANRDAFNIRENETKFVTPPEWRRGPNGRPEQSPAAYAIKAIGNNVVTIKAKFRRLDPTLKAIQVRALNICDEIPTADREEASQCVVSTVHPPPPPHSEVLGWVPPQPITFSESCETLNLQDSKITQAGVGVHIIQWQWQFRLSSNDSWKDLEKTCHQIYTVLKVPKRPWLQHPYVSDNRQLPWTDVLDYACYWADRAKDPDQAANKSHIAFATSKKFFTLPTIRRLFTRNPTSTAQRLSSC